MLNDRVLARRPWKYEKNSFVIDQYLEDEEFQHTVISLGLLKEKSIFHEG